MQCMQAPTPQTESPYETGRRLENVVRRGTIAHVDLKAARVRVTTGQNTTDWLPWLALRAGGIDGGRHWHPPVVGEQVLLLSQGGDLAQGIALLGLYSNAMPQGSDIPGHERMDWDGDNWWEWLHGAFSMHCLESITLQVADSCRLRMTPEAMYITVGGAALTVTPQRITSNVDIIAQGISLVQHKHTGITTGLSKTGKPTA